MFRIAPALMYGAAHSGKLVFPVTVPHLHHFASTSFVSLQEHQPPVHPSMGPEPITHGSTGPDPGRLSLSRSGYIAGLDTLVCIEGYKVSRKTYHGMHGVKGVRHKKATRVVHSSWCPDPGPPRGGRVIPKTCV